MCVFFYILHLALTPVWVEKWVFSACGASHLSNMISACTLLPCSLSGGSQEGGGGGLKEFGGGSVGKGWTSPIFKRHSNDLFPVSDKLREWEWGITLNQLLPPIYSCLVGLESKAVLRLCQGVGRGLGTRDSPYK
jgi:hypothetical protein